jgi:hypothetical protein
MVRTRGHRLSKTLLHITEGSMGHEHNPLTPMEDPSLVPPTHFFSVQTEARGVK